MPFLAAPEPWASLASNLLASWLTAGVTIFVLDALESRARERDRARLARTLRAPLLLTLAQILNRSRRSAESVIKQVIPNVSPVAAAEELARAFWSKPKELEEAFTNATWDELDPMAVDLTARAGALRQNFQLASGVLTETAIEALGRALAEIEVVEESAYKYRAGVRDGRPTVRLMLGRMVVGAFTANALTHVSQAYLELESAAPDLAEANRAI